MNAGDQPRASLIWRLVHVYAGGTWALFLAMMMWDVAANGDLTRAANAAGHYQASFVIWIFSLIGASAASALRAHWLEPDA